MPYIKQARRKILDPYVNGLALILDIDGDLNYVLFSLAKRLCHRYNEFKNFRGELMEAHQEIGRRLLGPYEDEAIERNGDVE